MTYGRGLLALVAGALMSGAALAQSAQTDVTIFRGTDRNAPAPAGVTVIRGEPGPQPQPRPAVQIPPRTVAAGEDFWVYDPEKSALTACNSRQGIITHTAPFSRRVGTRRIGCFTRHLSRGVDS